MGQCNLCNVQVRAAVAQYTSVHVWLFCCQLSPVACSILTQKVKMHNAASWNVGITRRLTDKTVYYLPLHFFWVIYITSFIEMCAASQLFDAQMWQNCFFQCSKKYSISSKRFGETNMQIARMFSHFRTPDRIFLVNWTPFFLSFVFFFSVSLQSVYPCLYVTGCRCYFHAVAELHFVRAPMHLFKMTHDFLVSCATWVGLSMLIAEEEPLPAG